MTEEREKASFVLADPLCTLLGARWSSASTEAHCRVGAGRCAIGKTGSKVICFNLHQTPGGAVIGGGTQHTASLVITAWRLFWPSGTTYWSRDRRWPMKKSCLKRMDWSRVLSRLCLVVAELDVEPVLDGGAGTAMITDPRVSPGRTWNQSGREPMTGMVHFPRKDSAGIVPDLASSTCWVLPCACQIGERLRVKYTLFIM
jgi:hypothetical protein